MFISTYDILSITLEVMGILRIRYDICSQGTHGPFGEGLTCGTTVNDSVGVDGVGKWGKCKMTKGIGAHRDGV